MGMGLGRLKWVDPAPVTSVQIIQKALIVGGGIAGMTSALGIADHGFQVDLVEKEEVLGGNLNWLQRTLEGNITKTLFKETMLKVEKHPLIRVHTGSSVVGSYGQVGTFLYDHRAQRKRRFNRGTWRDNPCHRRYGSDYHIIRLRH